MRGTIAVPMTDDDQLLAHPGRRALLEVLQVAGGQLSPGELSEQTGIPTSTRKRHLAALRNAGMITGNKQLIRLTLRGARALAACAPSDIGPVELAALIGRWPAEEQRSFVRLGIAEVVARQLFGEQRPGDLLGLAAIGAHVGTGKTLAGLFIARAVGLTPERALCRLPERAAGEIQGRLEPGNPRQWVPAPMLARPLVVLDEFDKADRPQQRAALAVLANGFCFDREGELHCQQAVPLLTANKDRALPEYAARRAIVLDLDPACARGELGGIAQLAGELDEISRAGMFPTIDLDALLPPASLSLPDADHRLLVELLARSLTDERMRTTNPGAVALIALAYSVLLGAASTRAMLAAVTDYLVVADTTSGTRLGWESGHFDAFAALADGGGLTGLQAALERRQQQRLDLQQGRERRQLEQANANDERIEQRAVFAQQLRSTMDRLGLNRLRGASEDDRAAAKGIAARLSQYLNETTAARSHESLDGVRERASEPLDRAGALLERLAAETVIKDELEQLATGLTPLRRIPAAYKPRARKIRADVDEQLRAVRDAHGERLVEFADLLRRALEEYDLLVEQMQRE